MDTQVEFLIRAAIERALFDGWTIVSDKQTTVNFTNKRCCPLGACYAVAGERVDTFTILTALNVGLIWAVEFTLGFDGIIPPTIENKDAFELGKKLRAEFIQINKDIFKMKIQNGQRWLWEGKTGRTYVVEIVKCTKDYKYTTYDTKYVDMQYAKLMQSISGSKPARTAFAFNADFKLYLTGSSPQTISAGSWTYLAGQDKPKFERKPAIKKPAKKKKKSKRSNMFY